jgi:hypothetical protein
MKEDTTTAKNLSTTEGVAAYDAAFKKFLSEKIILAWIMKHCVDECKDLDVEEIAERCIEGNPEVGTVPMLPDESNNPLIEGGNTEDTSVTEGTIRYDVRFKAVIPLSGELIHLIINCEAQKKYYPGYPIISRAIYYCSRLISSQYGRVFKHSQYGRINKVYSIFICQNSPKYLWNTITSYQITEKNLIGKASLNKRHYDKLTAVMVCLGDHEEEAGSLLNLLDVIVSDQIDKKQKMQMMQDDFHIKMTDDIKEEVSQMCNLGEGILERGLMRGRQETAQKIALNLAKLNMPLDKIAEATQESISVVKQWIEMESSKTK